MTKSKEIPFRDHHLCAFLKEFETSRKPLDLALHDYFRSHKSLGSKDRRFIGETLYEMIRWKSLVDYLCPTSLPQEQLKCFRKLTFPDCLQNPRIPECIRMALPSFLYERLIQAYGKEMTRQLSLILNTAAPTTVRVNLLKTTREALFASWKEQYDISLCESAPAGIHFWKREPLFSLPAFKEGLFEVQDEGSQLIAEQMRVKSGDQVLDYCSGSGGKTLAFAPRLTGKGQIYLHDIRPSVLVEAKKRLKRAGIQNAQCLAPNHPQLKALKEKMDWVLADVPCSGTGTLRRNPDSKWKIDEALVQRLVKQQKEIVEEALTYVKPGGYLLYSTCSILPEENQEQVEHFKKNLPLELTEEPTLLLPKEKGMDGFFYALFRKKTSLL